MREERKHFTPEEKVAILRRHLVDKVPVSELCEELGLRPTVFYRWQKELFENGAAAFQSQQRPHRQVEEKQKRIEFLEKKVQTKDGVLAELMAEHIALKKSWGPAYSLAYAGLADTYPYLSFFHVVPPCVAMPKAKTGRGKFERLA